MKKLLFVLSVSTAMILASCGGKKTENTPEAVTKAFFAKIQNLDFKGAKEYATKESGTMLDMMEMGMNAAKRMGKDKSSDAEMEKMKNAKFEIGTAKIDGDKATVPVSSEGKSKDITLKKENGNWKVAFEKNAMNKEGMDNKMDDINSGVDTLKGDMNKIEDLGDTLKSKMNEAGERMKELENKLKDVKMPQ